MSRRTKSLRSCLRYLGLCCQRLFGPINVWIPLENKRWHAISAEYFKLFDAKEKPTHKGDAVTDGDEEQIYCSHLPQTPEKSFFRNWQIQMWQEFLSCRPLQPCFWTAVLPLTVCHLWCAPTASHCCLQRPGHVWRELFLPGCHQSIVGMSRYQSTLLRESSDKRAQSQRLIHIKTMNECYKASR